MENKYNPLFCKSTSNYNYCPIFNVIENFKKFACQHPFKWLGEKLGLHALFPRPKSKWKVFDEVHRSF